MERTPNVAPIVAKDSGARTKAGKQGNGGKAATVAVEKTDSPARKMGVTNAKQAAKKLSKAKADGKALSPAKLERLNRMIHGDKPNPSK